MNRRPFYENYGAPTPNLTNQQPTQNSNTYWQSTMNNNIHSFNFNPSANPFHSSAANAYPTTAGLFNLTSISKNKTETHNNISKPLQKMSSDARPSTNPNEQSNLKTNKKHKKEYKLEELQKFLRECKQDIDHYERKRKRFFEEINRLKSQLNTTTGDLKICEETLKSHKIKCKNIQSDIDNKMKEISENSSRNSSERSNSISSSPKQNNLSNNHSPVQASANSINNLTINSNTKQANAASTCENVIEILLKKQKEVEFPKFDFIFKIEEEIYEPKPIDVVGSKFEINLTFKKLLSSEDKKAGYRYIIRGCVYDSKSVHQSDNLSFVKSYDFSNSSKKHSYENHDTSTNKLMFPFDITDYCRFDKKLNIIINLNKKLVEDKIIAFGVYYVKRLEFKETLEIVKNKELIRKKKSDITKNQVTNSFNQTCGIQMENYKISLIDPLSKARIKMPCIGETCEHIATFDGLTFLESNSKKFQWFCPICGKPILYNQLYYDELISEILRKVSDDCEMIQFDKLSNWIPLTDMINKPEVQVEDDCITLE